MSEGVVVGKWDDGFCKGEWYVEVGKWVKKGKCTKLKSKDVYAVASDLHFETKEQVEPTSVRRHRGTGNGEDGDNRDGGDNGTTGMKWG